MRDPDGLTRGIPASQNQRVRTGLSILAGFMVALLAATFADVSPLTSRQCLSIAPKLVDSCSVIPFSDRPTALNSPTDAQPALTDDFRRSHDAHGMLSLVRAFSEQTAESRVMLRIRVVSRI